MVWSREADDDDIETLEEAVEFFDRMTDAHMEAYLEHAHESEQNERMRWDLSRRQRAFRSYQLESDAEYDTADEDVDSADIVDSISEEFGQSDSWHFVSDSDSFDF